MMDSYGFTPFSFNSGRWTILRFGAPPPAADDASCANALMVQSQGLAPLLGRPPCPVERGRISCGSTTEALLPTGFHSVLRRCSDRSTKGKGLGPWAARPAMNFRPFSATTKICSGHWIAQDGHPQIPRNSKEKHVFGGASCMADLYSSRRYYTNVKTLKVPHLVQVPIPGPPPKVITHKARNFKNGKGWMGCFFFRSLGA